MGNILLNLINLVICKISSLFHFLVNGVWKENRTDGERSSTVKTVKDIPGPLALPFFGTMLTSKQIKQKFIQQACEERMSLYGPIVKEEYLGRYPMLHFTSTDHIELILKRIGVNRPGIQLIMSYRKSNPEKYDGVGLTSASGEEWNRLHQAVAPLLSPALVKTLNPESDKIALDFCEIIKSVGPTLPNLKVVLKLYVAEISIFNIFGTRMGFLSSKNGDISDKLQKFLDMQKDYWTVLKDDKFKYFTSMFPIVKKLPFLQKSIAREEDYMFDLIDSLTKEAMKKENNQRPGLMQHLLQRNDGVSLNDKRLLALELVLGTNDTVLSTITSFLYAVSKDTGVMDKLFKELCTVLPTKDSALNVEELNNLPYLKGCLMEVFRLYSATPFLMRIIEKEGPIGGYTIPAGTMAFIHPGYAARQPDAFYKPLEFLPERWIYEDDEDDETRTTPPFKPHKRNLVLPFGVGKRMCPGNRVIKQHLTILLARIIRNFHVSVKGPFIMKHEWISQPVDPIQVTFQERKE